MPRKKKRGSSGQLSASDLADALDVFGLAERLYPKLLSQHRDLSDQLQRIDDALARLRPMLDGGAPVKLTVAAPTRGKPGRPKGSGGQPTIGDLVLRALDQKSGPQSASEIAKSVTSVRKVSNATLQNALKALREAGRIKASGKARRFTYTKA